MKLPAIQQGGVQSLGRESNARAQAVQAEGAADQALFNLGADVVTEVAEIKDKYEVSKADVNLRTKMADLASEFEGQDYVDPNDPRLDEIDFDRTGPDGELRDRVPVHEVYAQLYENTARQALNESEAMISRPGSRDAWLATYGAQAEENIARAKVKATQQSIKFMLDEQNTNLRTLQAEGRYGAMDAVLENYIGSAEDKAAWKSEITVGLAKDDLEAVAKSGTPEEMRAEAVDLRDESKDYPFSMEYRHKRAAELERAADAVADRNANQEAHEWVQQAFASGKTEQQIIAEAQALPDSKMSDKAVSLAKSRIATAEAFENETQMANYEQLSVGVRDGSMTTADIPRDRWMNLTPQMRNSLEQLERRMPSERSASEFFNERQESVDYMNMAYGSLEDRKKFASTNIPQKTMLWGDTERNKIVNIWRQTKNDLASGNDISDVTGATRTQIFNEYVQATYGKEFKDLGSGDAANANKFSAALDEEIQVFYQDKGRNPTPTEMRQIAIPLVSDELLQKRWYWFDKTAPRFERDIVGVPFKDQAQLYEVIQSDPKWSKQLADGELTNEDLVRIYEGTKGLWQ